MLFLERLANKTRRLIAGAILATVPSACGADSNLMRALVADNQLRTFDVYVESATAAFDRGDLERAWTLGSKAYAIDPRSERAAILLGFIGLAIAGSDPFGLAKGMIRANRSDDPKNTSTLTGFALPPPIARDVIPFLAGSGADLEEETSTSSILSDFQEAIALTQGELERMGEKDTTDPDLPLLKPKCAEVVRQTLPRFRYLDQAILLACPYVDPEARIATDYRQQCQPYAGIRRHSDKAHLLWAFAHLTEALAFNAVLSYGTADPSGKKSNLELRAEKVRSQETKNPASLQALLSSVKSLEAAVKAVLPDTLQCSPEAPTSQIRATLHDLLAVAAGFGRLPSIPPKIVRSIASTIEKINSNSDSFQTLRADFSKKASQNLAMKIEELTNDPAQPLSAAQRMGLCSSLVSIGGGTGLLPEACRATSP